jgi:hypothetical protein
MSLGALARQARVTEGGVGQGRGGTRLRPKRALELIAPRTKHSWHGGEGGLLLGGGDLADVRSCGMAGCIGDGPSRLDAGGAQFGTQRPHTVSGRRGQRETGLTT